MQDDDPDAPEIVSAAASYLGDHATEIVQECTQLHGGIGVTWEHDLHLYLRRVTLHRNLYGTPAQHRERIAGCCSPPNRRSRVPDEIESVEAFRLRARGVAGRAHAGAGPRRAAARPGRGRARPGSATRSCSAMLWDGGFAGICFPKAYGGLGLDHRAPARVHRGVAAVRDAVAPQRAQLQHPRRDPRRLRHRTSRRRSTCRRSCRASTSGCSSSPSRPAAPTWPACVTRADRDGDEWVLNGSKIWSTAAMSATHAMCLARTDWDVAEAPWPHHVPDGDPPARRAGRPDPAGERVARVLPGILRRRARSRPIRSSAT